MKFRVLSIFLFFSTVIFSQSVVFLGKIIDNKTKEPIEFATIAMLDNSLWAVSAQDGEFAVRGIPKEKIEITVRRLGYVQKRFWIDFRENVETQIIAMDEDNLSLPDVVVTAKQTSENLGTAYTIDRNALNHIQVQNITDIAQLLPGGKTSTANTLLSASRFSIRSAAGGEIGNTTFGTGIEVDGVRLSNNTDIGSISGIDTRNIGVGGIQSVEVISGVASVEYGDINNGIIKIKTKQGSTPYIMEFSSNINTKQFFVSKGLALGQKSGVINFEIERTVSYSDIVSPYTSYKRNNISVKYANIFNQKRKQPISFSTGITGNIGGYNSKDDPDAFTETYGKTNDHTVRGHFKVSWLLNKKWITNLHFSSSVSYSNKKTTKKKNRSAPVTMSALHGTQEGYFVTEQYQDNPNAHALLLPVGYWYEIKNIDDRPVQYRAKLKADWVKQIGKISHKVKLGAEYSGEKNAGKGVYYDELRLAPDWRAYPYNKLAALHNLAVYAEEKMQIATKNNALFTIVAGVRADNRYVAKSEYGLSAGLSPRIHIKYTLPINKTEFLQQFSVYAGVGKSIKLPSFSILYPQPSYADILTFASPTTSSNNTTFTAYYTYPSIPIYNTRLKWQADNQMEIGGHLKTKIADIRFSAYYKRLLDSYQKDAIFSPFSYKKTQLSHLEKIPILTENRQYAIDQTTGIVTITDKTGALPAHIAEYKTYTRAKGKYFYTNSTPVHRAGIEWVVNFNKIKPIQTSVSFDGNFYYYKGVDDRVRQSTSTSAQMMSNGEFYKYIGFYKGGASVSNGSTSKEINANLNFTTHIPKLRMIITLRLESTLYSYSRNLSQVGKTTRGFVLDKKDDYFPSETKKDIYAGDQFVGIYPDYYVSFDDMETKIPFEEKFRWAKDNNTELYNNLARLVEKSNYIFYFNPNTVSPYFFANINITKEIEDVASISFYAKNFLNNMASYKASRYKYKSTLYNSGLIPAFYYGLTLRLKL